MSDSETDPDLTVSRYDEEDDLNYYGSPVYREEGERTAVEIAATATNDVAPSTSDNDRTQVSLFVFRHNRLHSNLYIRNYCELT